MEDDFFNRARSIPRFKSSSTSSIGLNKKRKTSDRSVDELQEISAGIAHSPISPPPLETITTEQTKADIVSTDVKARLKRKLTPPPVLSAAQKQAACETVLHAFQERAASESAIRLNMNGMSSIDIPSAKSEKGREVIEILVEGMDELTVPLDKPVLLIRTEAGDEVSKVKNAYCSRNGIGPTDARNLTLVWRNVRIFDFLTPKGLGMPPQSAVKIMPIEKAEKLWKPVEKEPDDSPSKDSVDDTPVKKPLEDGQWKRILMRDGRRQELRLEVRPTYLVSNLVERWCTQFNLAKKVKLKLSYEGEMMAPTSSVADAGLDMDDEDPDGIDVIDVKYI